MATNERKGNYIVVNNILHHFQKIHKGKENKKVS